MNDFNFLVWIRLKRTGFVLISNQIKDVRCSFLWIMYGRWRKNLFKDYILLYGQAMPMDNSILRNIVGCYKNRNLSDFFPGIILYQKFWRSCFKWSQFLSKSQGYSLQSRTLLNSITDVFMAVFRNSCMKNFEKYPGKDLKCSTLFIKLNDYSLQPVNIFPYLNSID